MSKLYFRYGAMGSGKTSALLQVAYNYEQKGMHIVLIKPQIDTNCITLQKNTTSLFYVMGCEQILECKVFLVPQDYCK